MVMSLKNRKKSKYRSVVINKKRYYFYKITWVDILGDAGHADAIQFNKFQPAIMISYGYIFSKFSDRNVYPIGCIKSLEKINI